ncbi:MAG: OadG family protein [Clostridia bacterium]|nr:OadG family protein [Clostridia bacterium]
MNGMPLWLSTSLLGLGTVFVGLILLILLTRLMSMFFVGKEKRPKQAVKQAETAAVKTGPEAENHGAFVAAVSTAIAQSMGVPVSGLRICSIRKIEN